MKKSVIFGAGGTGRRIYNMIERDYDVICFVDSDKTKWGKSINNRQIDSPKILEKLEFDTIFIGSLMGIDEIFILLKELGIPESKINKEYVFLSTKSREIFVENLRRVIERKNLQGAVAEAGVYRGEFAKIINRVFPERKCYLFDTFEGFDERNFSFEEQKSLVDAEHLRETSEQIVLNKMTTPENCIIRKGYFPETAKGLEEKFVFVNLDMDLYKPIYDGLMYFYPRMVEGGIILIHDYFSEVYPNVEQAVDDYEKTIGKELKRMPIGDDISLAIIK